MSSPKIKVGDMVMMRSGAEKGKTGKVTAVLPKEGKVVIEGINVRTRHQKPNNTYPQGGVFEESKPVDISKVGIVNPSKKSSASRIGYKIDSKGNKKRIYKATGKEIK